VAQGRKGLVLSAAGLPTVSDGVALAAPMLVRARLVGVVELLPAEGYPFDAIDLELLTRFCDRAAAALANACQFEDALLQVDRHGRR